MKDEPTESATVETTKTSEPAPKKAKNATESATVETTKTSEPAPKKGANGGPLGTCTCGPGNHTDDEYVWGCPAVTIEQQRAHFTKLNRENPPALDLARWVKRLVDAIDTDGDTLPTAQDARTFLNSLGYKPGQLDAPPRRKARR